MEDFAGPLFNGMKRKRTQPSRRPQPDTQERPGSYDHSSSSSAHKSDLSRDSNGERAGYVLGHKRKELNINQFDLSDIKQEGGIAHGKDDSSNGSDGILHDNSYRRELSEQEQAWVKKKRCSEGVLAPANWKNKSNLSMEVPASSVTSSGFGSDNKVKKVKLKVGGVTRTIQANSKAPGTAIDESSLRSSPSSDTSRLWKKQASQGGIHNVDSSSSMPNRRCGLQGIPWKDFSKYGFSFGKDDSTIEDIKGGKHEPIRKSNRVLKRQLVDESFEDDNDDDDDEIRYLEKLKSAKASAVYKVEDLVKKSQKVSGASKSKAFNGKHDDSMKKSMLVMDKDKKKNSSINTSEDADYEEEENSLSEFEEEGRKKKKLKKGSIESLMEDKRELTLTARQRALQSGKDASVAGASLVEFPDGLPPAPPRKQKEKLSEVEQQLKKAEAAHRRRMQVEKAARESEAEAIRKILGQDSSRKKREDKMKKRREELAQEKAANALVLGPGTVRWVTGPCGTTVTFPGEMGLPSMFNKASSYPPPREKCAGPACANPYKYRDSKTKLPLCSLQCYRAIHKEGRAEAAC